MPFKPQNSNAKDAVYVIAELGVNHNGDIEIAKSLVDVAVKAGANAVKLQTFIADNLVAKHTPLAEYQKNNLSVSVSQHEMLKKLEFNKAQHKEIKKYCIENNIDFISTPFDEESVEMLTDIGVAAIKLSSADLTNIFLLAHVSNTGLPVILSSGMSTLEEVESAMNFLRNEGVKDVAILHCVSDYPANESDSNLKAIQTLYQNFNCPVGWSDHTVGNRTATVAVSLGASIIEKHITISCLMEGPDHKASMEPQQFIEYVSEIRQVEKILGNGIKSPTKKEVETGKLVRRSLAAAINIESGQKITREMLCALRPGTGIPTSKIGSVINLSAVRSITKGELLSFDMLT